MLQSFILYLVLIEKTTASLDITNDREDRVDSTARTQELRAIERFGHTWTFNIRLLAVGLSGGLSALNRHPALSWHVEEGGEKMRVEKEGDQKKNVWLVNGEIFPGPN